MLYKSFSGTVKDVDEKQGIIKGYFAVYDVKDSDGDIIKPGAAKKTIQERGKSGSNRIKHLLQHDRYMPLAVPDLEETKKGIGFTSSISKTSYGKDTIQLYMDEVYTEHSLAFIPIKEHTSESEKANIISELEMWEGSTVTWGANELARGELKAKNYIHKKIEVLQKSLKDGNYTDETFKMLEKWLIKLTAISTHQFENEPDNSTQNKNVEPQSNILIAKSIAESFNNSFI